MSKCDWDYYCCTMVKMDGELTEEECRREAHLDCELKRSNPAFWRSIVERCLKVRHAREEEMNAELARIED